MLSITQSEAQNRFRTGSNCAQAVLSTYFQALGYDENLAHRIGAGLGSGIGRKQYVCGAVSAGAIVLSGVFGNEDRTNTAQKDAATERVRGFVDRFEEEFHTSQCRDLIKMDISTADGRRQAREAGAFQTVCLSCIAKVCALLDKEIESSANLHR
ncbi:MAG TPA: C-GCAxxG-C-C family protein [Bacteroidota bacterium]|nr:C-GCAxxG-C-C family protein [Bacteroidota bacterium]